MTVEQSDATLARLQEQLGVSIEVLYCPHAAGPPTCWWQKPLPGLGVVFIQLSPPRSVTLHLRRLRPAGPRLCAPARFQYRDAAEFFAPAS
jgi:hypothetical protein